MKIKTLFLTTLFSLCSFQLLADDSTNLERALLVKGIQWNTDVCNPKHPDQIYTNACKILFNLKEATGINPRTGAKYQTLEPDNLNVGRIAMAFGTDGCFPSSPVWSYDPGSPLSANKGEEINKMLTDKCAYHNQFEKGYVLYNEIPLKSTKNKDTNKYSARIYAMYAVKDETGSFISSSFAHKHEWEHIIVWMKNDTPDYVSVTQHSSVDTKKAKDVAHLKNDPNTFAVKYIHSRFGNIVKVSTHYFDFMDKDKNGVVKNDEPTPNGKWYGLNHNDLIDFSKTSVQFQNIIQNIDNWGETRPRINDKIWLDGKVCNIVTCPFEFMKSNVIPWDDVKTK